MTHLKRQKVPRIWPIQRKGNKFVMKPRGNLKKSLPLLVGLRDILEIVKTKKEGKQAILEKNILVNQLPVKDIKKPIVLFDKVTIVPSKKSYQLTISPQGKFTFEEIPGKDADKKTSKISDKKILKKKKIQINLEDGRNYLINKSLNCNVNDSLVINVKDKKVEECIPLKKGALAFVFEGKHVGEQGKVESINSEKKTVIIKSEDKNTEVLIKQMMVIK
ncbi:MAG: hypothetical protein ACOCUU_00735 [Nanoarchaeota archaeon]